MKRQLFAILLAILAVTVVHNSVQADLIANYKFDGDATDDTGNGNDGTAEGDAAYAGDATGFDGVGGAYSFSGAGHVVIPIDANPSAIPDLSVAMWVKPNENIPGVPGLYKTFGHDDGGWDRTFGLDNREAADGYRYAAFTGGARPGPTGDTGTPVTSDWTFIAAVWDTDGAGAGSNTVRFHVGENSITEGLTNTPSSHTTAAIGNLRPDNFNEGWQGLIDEVQIYDQALTTGQIESIRMTGMIPEPGSLTLLLLGCAGLAAFTRRRRVR